MASVCVCVCVYVGVCGLVIASGEQQVELQSAVSMVIRFICVM